MKGQVLSFPFISFSESGLFKGLRGIQIKKIFLPHGARGSLQHATLPSPSPVVSRFGGEK
jgi:hypothetical protein